MMSMICYKRPLCVLLVPRLLSLLKMNHKEGQLRNVRAYLYTIARHTYFDMIRNYRRVLAISTDSFSGWRR